MRFAIIIGIGERIITFIAIICIVDMSIRVTRGAFALFLRSRVT